MTTREAAERWRETWLTAWPRLEPEPIIALYAEGARLQSHPYREPQRPRDYIEPTLGEETSAECEFSEPIVDGDRAAVPWRATTQLRDGGTEHLVGVSLLRFDRDGLVTDQRDVWAMPEA
ncbi:MAG: nuclear transport factor 2 family protein [Gaiellales bacterium]